jgi:hypothetical protein
MRKDANYARLVADVLYTPTLLAYAFIVLHWDWWGVGVYALSLFVAYRTGAFEKYGRWPTIAKFVLYLGLGQILLAVWFSTLTVAYWMIIPFVIQALLGIIAYFMLRGLNSKA